MRLPRIVVAAPASGHGKTTVATGLMAALRAAGHAVSGHKVGPDYIDPGYHALATGRPGRNLDPHLVGTESIVPLLLHGARSPKPADVAIVEGVMGLYDGAIGGNGFASTAHVAALLSAPVVLVVDVSHASRSIAAIVQGMASYDTSVRIAGVILNKTGSDRHAGEVRAALEQTGVPVLGVLGRDDGIAAPSRHLGLVPARERPDAIAAVDRLAARLAAHVDLDAIVRIARSAADLADAPWSARDALARAGHHESPGGTPPVVAVAGGRAFTFRYAETDDLLRAAGCEPVEFDPTASEKLPERTAGLYLGGGFPELHAAELSANATLRASLRNAVTAGVPTVAECAGMLYLCRHLDSAPMVGAIPSDAAMTPALTLAYRTATAPAETLASTAGGEAAGHEFHRTTVTPVAGQNPAWLVGGEPAGFIADPARTGRSTLHASYLHLHWAGLPEAAARFAAAARRTTGVARPQQRPGTISRSAPCTRPRPETIGPSSADDPMPRTDLGDHSTAFDLWHHGDRETDDALVDLAVNVHRGPRPAWLDEALAASLDDLAAYPDPTAARNAIAARHARPAPEVLPTAGGAEAFTLLARARDWRYPVVVHPQFTEPEAALRTAGHDVHRVVLGAPDGFALDPAVVPDTADLVVVGNPTNPTGTLHPASTLLALVRPGRTVVVDEAFIDAVPQERESLASRRLGGLVVLRSLTKTWSIPGLRAGYVLADAESVDLLARQQPPWSVSAPAAAAMVTCSTPDAVREADLRACENAADRTVLTDGLRALGLTVEGAPQTPFVLVRGDPGIRQVLRRHGFAVRRGDTFPGLGDEWVRVAVRDPATSRAFLTALAAAREERIHG